MADAHILLIEPDSDAAAGLRSSLEEEGYRVSVSDDGVRGLVSLDTAPPDLVISELETPRLDGMSLVCAMKKHEETASIPVIFLTARADARSMIEGINVGAKFYIPKPYEFGTLSGKIKKALGG